MERFFSSMKPDRTDGKIYLTKTDEVDYWPINYKFSLKNIHTTVFMK
ncbi:MAG: hypothetical protein US49_C0001G0257 [candidate division TM6 bacterium GW2011_GWF2_37_49]|nr:MAG: hypothetical protein US49_C0001G0257 [candidate division TM6 bacterium GW2011_GWF2_37_49]